MAEAWVTALLVGYLLGSIPVGLWIGRVVGGVDLRQVGSGKTGATNTLRRLGKKWSLLVLGLDVSKGALPVLIVYLVWDSPTAEALAGLAAITGHIYPLLAGFRGGRGGATALGAILVLTPLAGAVAAGLTIGLLATTRVMSLSTLVALAGGALTQALLVAFADEPTAYYAYAVGAFVIISISHRDNIVRLLKGTEPTLGRTRTTPKLAPQPRDQRP